MYEDYESGSDDFYTYNSRDFEEGWEADIYEDDPLRGEIETDLIDEWN